MSFFRMMWFTVGAFALSIPSASLSISAPKEISVLLCHPPAVHTLRFFSLYTHLRPTLPCPSRLAATDTNCSLVLFLISIMLYSTSLGTYMLAQVSLPLPPGLFRVLIL